MLYHSLNFLRKKLDDRLRNSSRWGESKAKVSALSSGQNSDDDKFDCIKLTLINICQESSIKNGRSLMQGEGGFERAAPPQSFNVDFLMSAHCNHYEESLKLLSDCINVFQSEHYFDHQNATDLPPDVDRLSVTILDTELSEIINFWNCHGANYVPSIAYRMRFVTFDGREVKETVPEVSAHENG